MDASGSVNLFNLMIARRLLLYARQTDSTGKLRGHQHKSARDLMKEDEAILSGKPVRDVSAYSNTPPQEDNIQIHLRDLIKQLDQLNKQTTQNTGNEQNGQGVTFTATQVEMTTTIQEELSFQYTTLEPVDGLVVRNKHLAETDRYAFEFSDATTLKIIDKWSGKSTTIWGDPHVDVSDVAGANNGDFKDLTGSKTHTTFMLLDGTRLTITAEDAGIIQAIDIYKGDQHVTGLGAGTTKFTEKDGFFSTKVLTGSASGSSIPTGDTVYAGGDGNDWFDASKRLVWGQTTGPSVNTRPSAVMLMEYRYRMEQTITVNQFQFKA
jgi:hypothetical protein